MNEVSPLVLMFAMFFASLTLVFACVLVWALGHLKRSRITKAVVQLGDILKLINEALESDSVEKKNAVNSHIAEWDKVYSHELGTTIPPLSWH